MDLGELRVHVGDGDPHHALRRFRRHHANPAGEALDGFLGQRAVQRHASAEKPIRVEEARYEKGVGEGGVVAAAPVAGWARMGPGAVRADLGHPDLVDPCHRAPARADGGHPHHGHHHGDTADVLTGAGARTSTLDDRDVGAGSADVQGDDVWPSRLTGHVGGADDPRGRPGQERRRRLPARGRHRHDAAVGSGDVWRRGDAPGGERLLEAFEIAPHLGLHVRVEHGERRPLVLARLGPDVGRHAYRQPGSDRLGDRPRAALVGGVAIRVEERDHETLDALIEQAAHGVVDAPLVEQRVDTAVGAEPLAHFGDSGPRDQGQRARAVEVERVGQAQALKLQHVAKAVRDEEAEPGARALDQRVHGDGGAVDDRADLAEVDAVLVRQAFQAQAHRLGKLGGGRWHLEPDQFAGRRVEEGEVGEGPADVDAEPVPSRRRHEHRGSRDPDPPSSRGAGRRPRECARR
jgi:hypothetical protein